VKRYNVTAWLRRKTCSASSRSVALGPPDGSPYARSAGVRRAREPATSAGIRHRVDETKAAGIGRETIEYFFLDDRGYLC
jgi:hypothetical protein